MYRSNVFVKKDWEQWTIVARIRQTMGRWSHIYMELSAPRGWIPGERLAGEVAVWNQQILSPGFLATQTRSSGNVEAV